MKLSLLMCAGLLVSGAAFAADKPAGKPKPCPKGQIATTSKVTGERVCFAMRMMPPPGQPAPAAAPAKPKPN